MSRRELTDLTEQLAPLQAAQREQQRHRRRGAGRRAAGAGPRPQLTDADRILATILYLRRSCTHALLAELFTVNRSTITRAVEDTRDLLGQHSRAITPSTARFRTPTDLISYLTHDNPAATTEIN
ncbi:MAG: hypothetical protein JWN52_5992 [Actinomycetia bacterium]|nr:hypothetical protein [Actinomycetes bacterium]